jgi:MFS family permease
LVVFIDEEINSQKKSVPKIEEKPSIMNIFRNRSYMLVFGGQLLNMIASMLGGMTFSYLVYQTTQNASLMALMGILGSLPTVLIITFAGVIVDRFDQRTLIFISIALRAIFFTGFLLVFLFMDRLVTTSITYVPLTEGVIQRITEVNYVHFIWPMYSLLFLNNVIFSFYSLTASTYSKFIVEKKDLLVANSFNSTVNQLASVIGPILAGMIITVSYFYSFVISIGIASIGAILCLVLMFKGKKPPQVKREKTSFKNQVIRVIDDMKIGFNTIRSEPKVLYVLIVYMFFNFCTASINGVFSVVLQGDMELNATWYGAIIAVMSGIGVITSLVIMKLGKINRKLIIINLVIFAETIGLFLFAFNRNPWIMLLIITIPFGFVNGGANIPSFTLRQEKIPHKKLGRAQSFSFMFTSLFNLMGITIVTFIANIVDPKYIVLVGAILCLLLSIFSLTFFLTKRNLRCSDYEEETKLEIDTKERKDKTIKKFVDKKTPIVSSVAGKGAK